MTLPTFRSVKFRRKERQNEKAAQRKGRNSNGGICEDSQDASEETSISTPPLQYKPGVDVKRATRARRIAIGVSSLSFSISVIFLILTIIGNTTTHPVISSTYFFKLDLSSVYAQAFSSSNVVFINSIARSLGLHDFYQVGLWSYCEGYLDEGITYCSSPQNMYWFNPVSIILNELLSGATIALPSDAVTALSLVKIASNIMFGFFLTGIGLAFVCIFVTPLALYSRWWSLPLSLLTFVTALLVVTASIIATVMFSIFKNVLTSQAGLNIGAELGRQMLVFMWIGAAGSFIGFVIQVALSCCGASRRDVQTGRRMGSRRAYGDVSPSPGVADGDKNEEEASKMKGKVRSRKGWVGTKTPLEEAL